ncbi:U-box domain-containing protein 9-like [Chenopodium quinoa]|uniref:U-box domain-containing protein 9-like n=1 Tax=Chenopodium quinoa TaxID=63459 RepID=UPI000B77C58C|nr:U-box domain-containing protein 9-like [Chenopodium quinoa]
MAKSEVMGVSDGEVLIEKGNINNNNGNRIKSKELKKDLLTLVMEINQEEEEDDDEVEKENGVILGTIDKAIQALTALKELKLKKSKKKRALSSQFDQLNVPDEFRCPISREIMKDPVVLSTGQTYDRPFIQKWLKEGNRTCPQTQQVLSHIELTPNHLVRELILQWCKDHGIELPPPLQDVNDGFVTDADRNHLNMLLDKMSSTLSEQKKAAKEIRMLTKRMPSFRSFFGESAYALPQLLGPLTTAESLEDHPDLQEDLITTILNLSIHDNNKKLIAEFPAVIPLLIESLQCGTIETRANAAAALFTLSALDENKLLIAELGALKPLIELLEQGHETAMKDVTSALFNLCKIWENRGIAVRDGAVKVILKKLKERVHVSELLAILAFLSTHHSAIDELENLGSVDCLLSIISESSCEPDRENCIVILHDICGYSRFALKEVRDEEKEKGIISNLAENGTSRARRKASGLLNKLRLNRRINYTHTA